MASAFAAQMELVRQKAAEAHPPPASPPPGTTTSGGGSGGDSSVLEVAMVLDPIFQMFGSMIESSVVRPAAGWWATKGKELANEKRGMALTALQETLDRHPDLYYCARDDVVFLPGGKRFVPSREAGRLLMRNQATRLMEMLSP